MIHDSPDFYKLLQAQTGDRMGNYLEPFSQVFSLIDTFRMRYADLLKKIAFFVTY
jgi:hypothetical protein